MKLRFSPLISNSPNSEQAVVMSKPPQPHRCCRGPESGGAGLPLRGPQSASSERGHCNAELLQGRVPAAAACAGFRPPRIADNTNETWPTTRDVAQSHAETLPSNAAPDLCISHTRRTVQAWEQRASSPCQLTRGYPRKRHSRKLCHCSIWPKAMIVFAAACDFSSFIIYSNGGSHVYFTAGPKAPVALTAASFNVAMITLPGTDFPGPVGGGAWSSSQRGHASHLRFFFANFKANTFGPFSYQLLTFTKCN